MCGIYGQVIFGNQKLTDKEKFISLLSLSSKRGPDFQGYYSNKKNIQFGFNRLSILDLSENASQPIKSPSGRYIMVFNGEIYNHLELRNSLPKKKFTFKGSGDTESVISCFENFGIEKTISMLDGMFAIGIYDNYNSSLYLIIDAICSAVLNKKLKSKSPCRVFGVPTHKILILEFITASL